MKIHYLKLSLLTFVSLALLSLGAKAQVTGSSINVGVSNSLSGAGGPGVFGNGCTTAANSAYAFGHGSICNGYFSFASGWVSTASGTASFAMGFIATAAGDDSAAIGSYATANSYNEMVIGRYNLGSVSTIGSTYNKTAWVATDPLLELGNGTGNTLGTASNALTVFKNGNVQASGSIQAHSIMRCAAGGDLSMGSYTSGTAP